MHRLLRELWPLWSNQDPGEEHGNPNRDRGPYSHVLYFSWVLHCNRVGSGRGARLASRRLKACDTAE